VEVKEKTVDCPSASAPEGAAGQNRRATWGNPRGTLGLRRPNGGVVEHIIGGNLELLEVAPSERAALSCPKY